MAWSGIDNFDSYSVGDLTGGNGGTGWSGAWSGPTGFDVQTTTVFQGTKAIVATTGSGGDRIVRSVTTGASTGIIHIAGRFSTANLWQIAIREAGTFMGIIREVSGTIKLFDNVTLTNVENGAVSADTWFELYIEYDCATDKYRASVGGVPTGTWYTFYSAGVASVVDQVTLDHQNTPSANVWWDDLGTVTAAPTTVPALASLGVGA